MTQMDFQVDEGVNCLLVDVGQGSGRILERGGQAPSFLGGRGLSMALLAELGNPAWEALDPRQPFFLAAGPLTGSRAPNSSRFCAVGVSPLTGTVFHGNAGGRLGARLRAAGLAALAVVGRCEEWSVLVVKGHAAREGVGARLEVRLLPLAQLWPQASPADAGLVSSLLVAGLRKALGNRFSFVFPSVAGRRGALLSTLLTEGGGSLGRGGLGLALAARRLFAIAVAGEGEWAAADPQRFDFVVYEAQKLLDANPVTSQALPQFGTAVLMRLLNQAGALPVHNYRESCWARADAISGESVREELVSARSGCPGCRVRCRGVAGRGRGAREVPGYEALWALGADCGIDDLAALQEANGLCRELGLDAVSAGATIACAMELSEQGVLGRSVKFGDQGQLLDLVGKMGRVEGFGGSLARGSARLAEEWGHPQLAMQVKGLELPGYDPRGMQGQGLGYATCNQGGSHLGGNMLGPEILGLPKLLDRFSHVGKSGILINLQHLSAVLDSVCMCQFAGFAFGEEVVARLLSSAGGAECSAQDLLQAGERIWNLEHVWNLAAGFTRADDTLPERLLKEPPPEGPAAGRVVELEPMLDEYYRARGWSRESVPGADKLRKLGLEAGAQALKAAAEAERAARTEKSGGTGAGGAPFGEGHRHLRAV